MRPFMSVYVCVPPFLFLALSISLDRSWMYMYICKSMYVPVYDYIEIYLHVYWCYMWVLLVVYW